MGNFPTKGNTASQLPDVAAGVNPFGNFALPGQQAAAVPHEPPPAALAAGMEYNMQVGNLGILPPPNLVMPPPGAPPGFNGSRTLAATMDGLFGPAMPPAQPLVMPNGNAFLPPQV